MHPSYPNWLLRAVPSEATFRTKLSELRRVEHLYGDLDELYEQDGLEGLVGALTYTKADERSGLENPSLITVDGNLYNSLASYKSAVQKYARFRQDVELEAARPIIASEMSALPALNQVTAEYDTERTFSMERDLQAALRSHIGQLEPGLTIIDGGTERAVPSGRIDILAQDGAGCRVVVELKAVKAPRDAVAQVLAYMGDLIAEAAGDVRGILVAPDFDPRATAAARAVPGLKLLRYTFTFAFSEHS